MKKLQKMLVATIAVMMLFLGNAGFKENVAEAHEGNDHGHMMEEVVESGEAMNFAHFTLKFLSYVSLEGEDPAEVQVFIDAVEAHPEFGMTFNHEKIRSEMVAMYEGFEISVENITRAGEVEAVTDANGIFMLDLGKLRDYSEVKLLVRNPQIDHVFTTVLDLSSEEAVVEVNITQSITAAPEEIEQTIDARASATNSQWKDGEKGVVGYRLHCNRFNGATRR